jgi:hypothetical protein
MTLTTKPVDESQGFISKITSGVGKAWQKAPSTDQVKSQVSSQTARVGQTYGQIKKAIGLEDYKKQAELLKAWAPVLANNGKIAKTFADQTQACLDWLAGASTEDAEKFTRQLASFCSSLNFQLLWLIDEDTAKTVTPSMKQTMTDVVHLYSLSRWEANLIQEDICDYLSLREWLSNPAADKYQALNQRLFAAMVEAKLVETPSLDLFLASEADRQAHFVEASQQVLAQDVQRFHDIFGQQQAALAEEAQKAAEAEAEAAAEAAAAEAPAAEAESPAEEEPAAKSKSGSKAKAA